LKTFFEKNLQVPEKMLPLHPLLKKGRVFIPKIIDKIEGKYKQVPRKFESRALISLEKLSGSD